MVVVVVVVVGDQNAFSSVPKCGPVVADGHWNHYHSAHSLDICCDVVNEQNSSALSADSLLTVVPDDCVT